MPSFAWVFWFACSSPSNQDAELPESDTFMSDTGVAVFPMEPDLDSDLTDPAPQHTLTVRHWGIWNLTPISGPYTAFTGTLWVQEYEDGWRPEEDTGNDSDSGDSDSEIILSCDLEISLTGELSEYITCTDCDPAFDVLLSLASGDPSGCRDPQILPFDETYRYAYSWNGFIQLDYGSIGLWVPWYSAEFIGDSILFEWEESFGIVLEEEEP